MNATRLLPNRVAMVSGGMGQAICAQLARQWGIGDLLSIQPIDIRDASSVSQAIAAQGQALGTPDMRVHAAGGGPVAPWLEATAAMWQATLQGKLLGTIRRPGGASAAI